MEQRVVARTVAGMLVALGAAVASAQPAAPSFAPPNTTAKGLQSMAAACAMCHGTNGRTAANSPVASLAGRPKAEFVQSMTQFKAGQRPATIMHQIAKGYSDAEIAALAEYFAGQSR
jgi:cytochrome c553